MLFLILLILALICFGANAMPNHNIRVNLDAAGKAFLVGALIAHTV